MPIRQNFLLLIAVFIHAVTCSQSSVDSLFAKQDPQKFAASISKKTGLLEEKIEKKTLKTLEKLQKHEEKIYHRLLNTKDSLLAKAKLEELKTKYSAMREQVKNPSFDPVAGKYLPIVDSFCTSLKFLEAGGMGAMVKDAITKTKLLQGKFSAAEEVKKFIAERKEQLKLQLDKLGLTQKLKQLNKQVYYYTQQVNEYKEILNDPKKIEKKVLELLSKTKAWKDFFARNSMLASLFRMPGDPNDPAAQPNLAGLQTRAQVNNLIQQQLATGGPNAQQQFRQNIQAAQSQLNELKNKILKAGGSGSGADPDSYREPEGFKPNNQKTKSFFQRLELGTNMQTQKATNYFPVTSDIGLSLGYKLNDKSVIGVGASYKLGWGKSWNDINITQQGVGLRTFIDIKLKGSFWMSGGYEQNYKPEIRNSTVLIDQPAWQQSGLVGISKVISLKSKLFKKTSLKLLWDFLSYRQVPRGQAVVFRVGYNF